MKNILLDDSGTLERFASSNVLLAFDYDGTLAPIVDQPDEARMRPQTCELVREVTRRYPCVVISGRAQGDALRRVRGLGMKETIGNHGLHPTRYSASLAATVQSWIPTVNAAISDCPGVALEDKVFSIAVHYRGAEDKESARQRILAATRSLAGLRVTGGKDVVNLVPSRSPHKGEALRSALVRLGCEVALFVGDDETDEDAFSAAPADRLLGIRVGAATTTAASFFVPRQPDVDDLLARLIARRDR